MTRYLLRIFVPNYRDCQDPKVRTACGRLSGIVGIVCNVLLFLGKLLVGTLAGSVAITADALNNLSDASSSLVTLLGFHLAGKPADEDHPYGHARVEYIAGLGVSAMILLIGVELAKSSVEKILHPEDVAFSWLTAAVLLASIGVKLWMTFFNRKMGKLIQSPTLEATAADSRNDCVSTGAVLLASLVQASFGWHIDGVMGLLVALFIVWSGIGIAGDTISPLLGHGADPELQETLAREIRSHEKVLGFHDLMVHDYGPGQRFATLHLEMDAREDPLVCHDLIDNIERICLEKYNVHMCIHYDPIVVGDPELDHMRQLVSTCVRSIDSRLSIHDFRMVQGPSHTNLIFDVAIPFDMKDRQKDLKNQIDQAVKGESPRYYTVITFDRAACHTTDCERSGNHD